MLIFYKATIESVLRYGIIVWFKSLTVKLRAQINNVLRVAGKIMGTQTISSLQDIFELCITQQANKILLDSSHVLYPEYMLMNSGRRYRVTLCKYNRYKYSFLPLSIKLINEQMQEDK